MTRMVVTDALRRGRLGGWRSLLLCSAVLAGALMFASASSALAAKSSANVGYITDFGTGSNDTCGPGCGSSLWVNALTGVAPEGSYTTADGSKTVAITDVPVSTIDTTGESALTPFDTLILYEVCDIADHPNTVSALNTFVLNGGKLIIYDADRCFGSDAADYSSFLFPFSTSSPGPDGASGSYTTVVPSSLTTGLSVGPQPFDAVGDANIFTSFSGAWCASITATNELGANGFVEATARTPAGGLVIYEGEDNWFTDQPSSHLRLVFDDMIEQNWDPDGLPCTIPASGISLAPASQTDTVGGTANLTAKVVDINGNGESGVTVTLTIGTGPNAGKTLTAVTDSNGNAAFAYSGTQTGTDVDTATFVDSSSAVHTSNTANVVWAASSTTPTTPSTTPVQAVKAASVSAKLSSVPEACVSKAFIARVDGKRITSVRFTLDGRKFRTTTVRYGQRFSARISVTPGRHRLTVKIRFHKGSAVHSRTLHATVIGCIGALPKFTG